jgi:hypothetical protein
MGKKGLSFEEKRQRMLEFFYEKQEVLTLKELEKLLPKAKGIVSQSVKDVLQSLVDDSLIDFDKIGSGNFFWALPSGATIKRKQHEDKLRSELESLAQKTEELKKRKIELEADRKPSKEREEKLASLQENRIVIESLNSELEKYRLRGPERVRELGKLVFVILGFK